MAKETPKLGDVVQLKSGSHSMTITNFTTGTIDGKSVIYAICTFYIGDYESSIKYPLVALKTVE